MLYVKYADQLDEGDIINILDIHHGRVLSVNADPEEDDVEILVLVAPGMSTLTERVFVGAGDPIDTFTYEGGWA